MRDKNEIYYGSKSYPQSMRVLHAFRNAYKISMALSYNPETKYFIVRPLYEVNRGQHQNEKVIKIAEWVDHGKY